MADHTILQLLIDELKELTGSGDTGLIPYGASAYGDQVRCYVGASDTGATPLYVLVDGQGDQKAQSPLTDDTGNQIGGIRGAYCGITVMEKKAYKGKQPDPALVLNILAPDKKRYSISTGMSTFTATTLLRSLLQLEREGQLVKGLQIEFNARRGTEPKVVFVSVRANIGGTMVSVKADDDNFGQGTSSEERAAVNLENALRLSGKPMVTEAADPSVKVAPAPKVEAELAEMPF